MPKHVIGIGDGGIGGRALVDQRGRDGSVRQTMGDFDLSAANIARIQLDRVTVGRLRKREEDRILIMTKSKNRIELYRSKMDGEFDEACGKLKHFAKSSYVTFQDDLGVPT